MHCIKILSLKTKTHHILFASFFFLSFKLLMLFCVNNYDVQNGTLTQNLNDIENQIFEGGKKITDLSKEILRLSILCRRTKELTLHA